MNQAVDPVEQQIEHVAAELWMLREEGACDLAELRRGTSATAIEHTLVQMAERGLVARRREAVDLTAAGRELAERQVRRYRLAELLLSAVLDVRDDSVVTNTACAIEHVLHPSVTESVCAFLGHPKFCPHGKAIPAGRCCRTLSNSVEPLVQPLDQLAVGQAARVVYIVPREPARLVRLSSLGLVPGTTLRLQQKRPATVIALGETVLAIERDIAAEIYVKRVD